MKKQNLILKYGFQIINLTITKSKRKWRGKYFWLLSKLSIQSKHATTTSSFQRTPVSNASVGVLVSLSSLLQSWWRQTRCWSIQKNRCRHLRQFYRVCRKVPFVSGSSMFFPGWVKGIFNFPKTRSQNQGIICIGFANPHPLPPLGDLQGPVKIPWPNGWGLGYAKRVETGQEHWMLGLSNPKQTDGKKDG